MCRSVGHSWDVIDATSSGKFGGNPIWLRCERCMTERHDFVNSNTGDLYTRQYVYQDSYRHAFDDNFGDAAPTRTDYRMMFLQEAMVKQRDKRLQEQTSTNNQRKAV